MTDESESSQRSRRAFADHDGFVPAPDGDGFVPTNTPFDGRITVDVQQDGQSVFNVSVRVPMLSAVTEGEVAEVVEEGWYETFTLRVLDVGDIFRTPRDLDPVIRRTGDGIFIEETITDPDERRGIADTAALIDFIEGTYVQGVIPGYEYTEPVASILAEARQRAGSDGL